MRDSRPKPAIRSGEGISADDRCLAVPHSSAAWHRIQVSLPALMLVVFAAAFWGNAYGDSSEYRNEEVTTDPDFEELGALVDESNEELVLPRERAPGYQAGVDPLPFTFCPSPAGAGPNLTNAAWLGYFAANQYSHLSAFAPLLLELGFGDRGDILWPVCSRDLAALRSMEAEGAIPANVTADAVREWGACARDWVETAYLSPGNPTPPGLAAAFESYLIQEASTASDLQFFSGGEFSTSARRFKAGSTQVVWARHTTLPIVVVAFRGTEPTSIKDVLIDAKFWKTSLTKQGWTEGWGKAHAGFTSGFRAVTEAVNPATGETNSAMLMKKLDEIAGGEGTECTQAHPCVWVTGHSLGAALATLFASRMLSEMERGRHFKLRGLYTFGSPRVGNKEFQQKFESEARKRGLSIVRVRNGNDIVTRVPKLAYRHISSLGWLTENEGEILIDADITEPRLGRASDHSMVLYYEKLATALGDTRNSALATCPTGD